MARPVPKNRTLVLDRRTTRRFFILRPDADGTSRRVFFYCVAVIAKKHGIVIHAMVQMSTHWHVCLTDVRGVLPYFLADVHRTLAECFKKHRGWEEEVWNKSQTGTVDIETSGGALKQLAYLMCNPIEAGMVRKLEEYPGALSQPGRIGRCTSTLRRPSVGYFKSDEIWPKTATLSFELPEVLTSEFGETGARRAIVEAVNERAEMLRTERAANGLGYLGAKAVCEAPVTTCATKEEVRGGRKPTFALGTNEGEVYRRKLEELREWRAAYARCLERWRQGDRDVLWPPNTWKMRVLHGVRCAPPD